MRQIRVSTPRTRVADDVRAGLTALGKGDVDVGGVALVGLPVPGTDDVLDAVVIGPTGVAIIAGVDLPGPAVYLDAPLYGQWKADNWPLVGADDAVNPGAGPLATAQRLAQLITEDTALTVDVATVLAVGPYADQVSNGPTTSDRVAVTYPTAPNLRAAIVDLLGTVDRPCSVELARAVLHAISSRPPVLRDTELVAEGFRAGATAALPAPGPTPSALPGPAGAAGSPPTTPKTVPATPSAEQLPAATSTTAPPAPNGAASGTPAAPAPQDGWPGASPAAALPANGLAQQPRRGMRRAVPIATGLLVMVAVIVLVVMLTGSADSDDAAAAPQQPSPSREHVSVAGTELTVVATATSDDCTQATVGDVQATVIAAGCTVVRQGSYLTTSQPEAAVSVAEFEVHDPSQAQEVRRAAETPGGGAATDIATVQQQWPDNDPRFTNAAYDATTEGSTVRLARAAWTERDSSPDDEQLRNIAETALAVPLAG